jgi:type I restriction enzyme S subunit
MEAIGEDWSLDLSRRRPVAEVLTGYSYLEEGDIAFAKVTPCFENGKAAIMRGLTQGSGFGTTELTVVRPSRTINTKFLFYVLNEDHFRQVGIAEMTGAGGLKRVPDRVVRDYVIDLPSRLEQNAIVSYLDRETAEIDAFIAEQEELIGLLTERRAATITHAVTKGLDPSVQMKDSGVEWLGEIPATWTVASLRRVIRRVVQGVSPQAEAGLSDANSFGVLRAGCVNGGVFNELEHKRLPDGFEIDDAIRVRVGDLIVNRASGSPALVGSAARVREMQFQLILSDKTFRLDPNALMVPDFLELYLNSSNYRLQVLGAISGAEGLANNLPITALRAMQLVIPPCAEQQGIVSEVARETAELDAAIADAREAIALSRERRAALISAAVTGKIDVRGAI